MNMEVRTAPDSVAAPLQPRELAPDHPLRSMDLSSTGLKIVDETDQITNAFDQYDTMIVSAGTGGGKTIGLPLILLRYKPHSRIAITQPRNAPMKRISSRTAELAKDAVGGLIGVRYKGSGEKWSDKTQIMYEMEQTLLNELEEDLQLRKYNIAMVDEQHEAGGRTQFLLQRLMDAQKLRKDEGLEPLKIVIASATIDTQKLKDQLIDQLKFQRKNEQYAEEALKKTIGVVDVEGATPMEIKKVYADRDFAPEEMPEETAKMAKSIIDTEENQGDILIFLAGMPEIRKAGEELAKRGVTGETFDIHILSSATTEEEKEAIASKMPGGKRKIILSTNSGETGMTYHKDLYYMIDTGLIKQTMVDKDTGMEFLATVEHTWSGCMQRDGRLGRVGSGEARHLYTKKNFELREQVNKYPMPEIQRSNLIPYVLELLRIGKTDVRNFRFLDQPDPHIIDMAMKSLKTLGAIDEHEHLTPIGREMATMGIEPHLARMVVEAQMRGCLDAVSLLVGLMNNHGSVYDTNFKPNTKLSEKYAKYIVPGSDFLTQLAIWNDYVQNIGSSEQQEQWAMDHGINTYALYEAASTRKDLLHSRRIQNEAIELTPSAQRAISACIAAGLADSLLEKTVYATYQFPDGRRKDIFLDRNSILHETKPTRIVSGAIRYDEKSRKTFAGFNMAIDDALLREAAPYLFGEKKEAPPIREPETSPLPSEEQKRKDLAATAPATQPSAKGAGQPVAGKTPEVPQPPLSLGQRIKRFAARLKESIAKIVRKVRKVFSKK